MNEQFVLGAACVGCAAFFSWMAVLLKRLACLAYARWWINREVRQQIREDRDWRRAW